MSTFVKCDICEQILGSNQQEVGNFIRLKKKFVFNPQSKKDFTQQQVLQPEKQDLCENCAASVERYLEDARQQFLKKETNEKDKNNP